MKGTIARRILWALAILGFCGFLLSIESYREYHKSAQGEETWCSFGELSSCEKAFQSEYSRLFGRPISLFGAVAYFLVAAIALLALMNGGPHLPAAIFHLALFSIPLLGATGYFAWALFTQVKTICILCVGDYTVNLLIAGLSWWGYFAIRPRVKPILEWDLRSTFGSIPAAGRTIVLTVLILVLGAVVVRAERRYYLFKMKLDTVIADKVQRVATPWAAKFPAKGPADAPIQVIVFGDHECPYCGIMKNTLSEVMDEYPGLIRYATVAFPLNSDCNGAATSNTSHQFACQAAHLGLEVLAKKGEESYWKIHDALYLYGLALNDETIEGLATEYGLSPEDLEQVRARSKSTESFALNVKAAELVQLGGLPTVVMNGVVIDGYVEDWAFLKVIEAELERAGLDLESFRRPA